MIYQFRYGFLMLPFTFVVLSACSPAKFREVNVSSITSLSAEGANEAKVVDTFEQGVGANKVDILIINDNSASMDQEQLKVGQRFSSFISEISDLDYQIAMTTTDLDSQYYDLDGEIMTWAGAGTKILTPQTPNQSQVFLQNVERFETSNCLATGKCPSGNEQPLGAMVRAFQHRNDANKNFFRDQAPLAIFVISDEDEMSDGKSGTKATQVLSAFQQEFGMAKRLAVYGIIVQPGDDDCRDEQRSQQGASGQGYFGTHVDQLSALTGGKTLSICSTDYSAGLAQISHEFRSLATSYELSQMPVDGNVEVIFTPAQNIRYSVQGRTLTLETPAPYGTKIEVRYNVE